MSSKLLLVIVGIPGVGKTTVLNAAVEILVSRGYVVRVLNYGDYMLKSLISRNLVRSRDEIRRLPLQLQREVQALVADDIRREVDETPGNEKVVSFVDTHAVIKTTTGYWPGLPKHVIERLSPDAIIVIEASPEEVLSRQLKDRSRYRADYADVNLITELLQVNRCFAIASAVLVGASLYIIHNREGRVLEAASELVNIVNNLMR